MTLKPKNTETGKKKEKDVVRWLEKHGWEILYEGGRGSADIKARQGSTKWFIQVKYTRSTEMPSARFDKEREDLIKLAEKHHATPVLCYVIQRSVWFDSARTGENLKRGSLRD
jgi:Holliday junction resolvase